MSNSEGEDTLKIFEERKEVIQDVIDRWLYNPEYRQALRELNEKYPAKDCNRRLEKTRLSREKINSK